MAQGSPPCELSVRLVTAMVSVSVRPPARMISLPPVKSPQYDGIADYPCAAAPVHILVTIHTHVFIAIPGIILRGVSRRRGRPRGFHNDGWRSWPNLDRWP